VTNASGSVPISAHPTPTPDQHDAGSLVAGNPAIERLRADFDGGKPAALARAVSMVENQREGFEALLNELHARIGRARRIGITGPPGAGKSTLTTRLVETYRRSGLTVGIIAVDPTSPFTGGALLGDRIRMEAVALDPGVYIRSLATRGSLGGISGATRAVADVLDAFGFDRILMETVGVGQSELEIANASDTTVVLLVPESGDSIQTLKAGLMEIADIFVINKADRPGADRVRNDVELMLGLRAGGTFRDVPAHHGIELQVAKPARTAREVASREQEEAWVQPVLKSVATNGEGIDDVVTALDRHFRYLQSSGHLAARRRRRLREQVVVVAEHRLRGRLWGDPAVRQFIDEVLPRIEAGELSPFGIADELLARGAPAIARTDQ
jgi:LAO/AO transport system kinase